MRSLRHPLIFLPSRLSDIQSSLNRCRLYRVTMFAGIHQQRLPEDEGCLFYYFNYSCQHYQKKPKTSYWKLTANICYILRIDFFSLAQHSLGQALPGEEVRFCNRIKILFYLFLFKHFILPREDFHCLVYDFYMFQ